MRLYWLLLGCCLPGCLFPIDTSVTPDATPAPPLVKPAATFGLDISIPPTMPDKGASLALAELAREYADQLEYDGTRETPLVTTTADVGRKFQMLNAYAWKGANKAATSAFKQVTAAVVKQELEPDGAPRALDEDDRKTAAELFRAIEYGLRLAAQ